MNDKIDGPLCQLVIREEIKEGLSGTFAIRSPHRPNPIGAAVLTIETIHNGVISVKGIDCLNGTHLLDIKPAILHEVR